MTALRKFGVDIVGDVPWGTHLCMFYATKDDLAEILVPYFAEGLRSNEACMWVTSEPLEHDEALTALARAVPNVDQFLESGQLLMLPYTEWHMKGGTFDADRVMQGWLEKEQEALTRGFEGLRLAGNTFWIERGLWDAFTDYEEAVNAVIGEHRMIGVCPYSLEKCGGTDVVDVIRNHVGTIIKQGGSWSVVEDVVRRKEAERALEREHKKVQSLNDIIHVLNGAPDLPTLHERILLQIITQLGFDRGLMGSETATGHFIVHSSHNVAPQLIDVAKRASRDDNVVARTLFMEQQPVVYDEVPPEMPAYAEGLRGAFVAIPFLSQEETVGCILLNSNERRSFTHHDRSLFQSIGLELGTTVAKLRAKAQAEEYTRQQAVINRVIKAGNEADTLPKALHAMLDAAMELINFTDGALFLLNEAEGVTEQRYARGFNDEVLEAARRIPLTTSFYAQVYEGTPKFFNEYPTEGTEQFRVLLPEIRILALVPLVAERRVIGHYVLASAREPPFTDDERALLIAIGRQAGTVLARLQAEEQARATSLYARSLIEASLDPLVTIDARGTITDVNKATEEVTGCSREELIGSDFSDYFTEPDNARAGYKQVFENGYVRDYPLIIRSKSGAVTDVVYNATVYRNEAGEVQGVFAAARDVTDRKHAEEELQRYSGHLEAIVEERTAQLKKAERLAGIGETAAMIGHDLRNPLQGLQYIVDLQKLRFERVPPHKRSAEDWKKEQALFDRISEQLFYMDKIVGDLQDYARPVDPEREAVSVRALIDEVIGSLPPADGVELRADLPDLTIDVEPHLIHRVFSNLFLNAMQAMPKGGTLTIDAEATDGTIAIHVTDTGTGIPADMREKIFSPLTTGKAKGTGLGLAVVKRIVEAHNGTITFESAEGKGTTFTVTLPQTVE
ncbi:MAG: MEDS domain-containing protein [Halobacteriota archaeon]